MKHIPDARICCSMVLTKAVTKPAGTVPLKFTVYLKKSIPSSKTSISLNAIGKANIFVAKRDLLLQNLKGTPFFVSEDFPYEIEQNRRLLLPVYLQARKSAVWKEKVKLKGDKLIVEDVVYTVETINKLPTGLNPAHQSTRENDRVMVFQGAASPFSNSCACSFQENGVISNNVEQYTLYHKAIAVKDDVTATRMLGLNNISEQRRLGKSIPSFPLWRGLHREKTETGNKLKFSQYTTLAVRKLMKQAALIQFTAPESAWLIRTPWMTMTERGRMLWVKSLWDSDRTSRKVEALRSYTSFYITADVLFHSATHMEMTTLIRLITNKLFVLLNKNFNYVILPWHIGYRKET